MTQHWVELILVFLTFYLPGFIAGDPSGAATAAAMLRFLAAGAPQAALLAYLIWLRSRIPGEPAPSAFGVVKPQGRDLLLGGAAAAGMFGLLVPLAAILAILPSGVRQEVMSGGLRWRLAHPALLPLALLFSLVTGYREELFFRSYLLIRLPALGVPPAGAVAASTVLFATGHLYQGVPGLAVALVQGLYFALLFLRTRNLHALAIAHGLYNLAALLLSTAGGWS